MAVEMKERILGVFWGVATGDALGMPVETFDRKRIEETYGFLDDYVAPDGHKWFNGEPAGMWTDDTQLTLAVARGLMGTELSLAKMAEQHKLAYDESTKGWGGTTKRAVRNLKNGVDPSESGLFGDGRGKGNGVAMKIAPFGILMRHWQLTSSNQEEFNNLYDFIFHVTMMTHRTEMATVSAFAQVAAVNFCMGVDGNGDFPVVEFIETIINAGELAQAQFAHVYPEEPKDGHDLVQQFRRLYDTLDKEEDDIGPMFGEGTCYCYHSLPFTYAYFLYYVSQPADSVLAIINSGGDTDTNASMAGALVGAWQGINGLPNRWLRGLMKSSEIQATALKFSETLGY